MIALITAKHFETEKLLTDDVLTDLVDINENHLDPAGLIVGYNCW